MIILWQHLRCEVRLRCQSFVPTCFLRRRRIWLRLSLWDCGKRVSDGNKFFGQKCWKLHENKTHTRTHTHTHTSNFCVMSSAACNNPEIPKGSWKIPHFGTETPNRGNTRTRTTQQSSLHREPALLTCVPLGRSWMIQFRAGVLGAF